MLVTFFFVIAAIMIPNIENATGQPRAVVATPVPDYCRAFVNELKIVQDELKIAKDELKIAKDEIEHIRNHPFRNLLQRRRK